eukprot:UN10627
MEIIIHVQYTKYKISKEQIIYILVLRKYSTFSNQSNTNTNSMNN